MNDLDLKPADPTVLDRMPMPHPTAVKSAHPTEFSQTTLDTVLSMRNGAQNSGIGSHSTMDAKIVLLGDAAVGKTCLFYRIFRNDFTDMYKTTIGVDFCLLDYQIMSVPLRLQLWDTAGSERFRSLTYAYYRGAQVVILVFDVTKEDAVPSLRNWHSEVETMMEMHNTQTRPLFFAVGTKVDLITGIEDEISAGASLQLQKVEQNVKEFCEQIEAELWFTSSKLAINIDAMFSRVAAVLFNRIFVMRKLDDESNKTLNHATRERPDSGRIRLKPDPKLKNSAVEISYSGACCGH